MYDVEYLENVRDYVFQKTGKWYLKKIRDGKENILCTCPSHKDGQESNPSCGFSKVDTDSIGAGFFHCFNCGFTGDTHAVLRLLLGELYDKEEASRVLGIEDYEFESRLNAGFQLTIPKLPWETKYVSEKELQRYRLYPKYLENRGISMKTAEKYDIGYDSISEDITFPIRDKTGGTLAVGRRSVRHKRYEYPLGFTKPVYGVYELPSIIDNKFVWVVEGPFNLWTLNEYKKEGVALLGTGTKNQYEELLTLNTNKFVLALDGDPAGRKGNMKLGNFLKWNRKEVFVACVVDGEDINSMTKEEFSQMYVLPFEEWVEMIIARFHRQEDEQENINEDFEEDLD